MIKTITESIIDGYPSGKIDFLEQLLAAGKEVSDQFDAAIIQPILAVLNSPDQCAVLTIAGHSDRVDTEGLTREQRRQQELEKSEARADSAEEAMKIIIRANFSGPLPDDLDTHPQLAILNRVAGAALLKEPGEALTEAQRTRNRRVQFRVVRFQQG